MRVGQPRLLPRAEKRAIACFVSTTDVQSILDLVNIVLYSLDLVCDRLYYIVDCAHA